MENYIVGTCKKMCPETEIEMREREGLLHRLEMMQGTEHFKNPKADPHKTVKAFSRSAAGRKMSHTSNIRPADVLLQTVNYLLQDVVSVEYVLWNVVYDFVMDRLRAVRQDIVVQNLSKAHTISLLQPIIRFYAYSSYRLCEEDINIFDPEINRNHLQECLKRILVLYDDCDYLKTECSKTKTHSVHCIALEKYFSLFKNDRPYFETLYILFNLGNAEALTRALSLPSCWKSNMVNNAVKLSLYYINGNWIRVCRMIKELPPLLAAVSALHLPTIRRNSFKVLSTSYASKNQKLPASVIKHMLLYSNEFDVIEDCQHYNIKCNVEDNTLYFSRGSFNISQSVKQCRHETFIEEKLSQHSISSLLLYNVL